MHDMCGRVIQASLPDQVSARAQNHRCSRSRDNRVIGDPFGNVPPRYNGAPSQQLWVIRQVPQTGERSLDLIQWGLIPYWCKDKPKTVTRKGLARDTRVSWALEEVGQPAAGACCGRHQVELLGCQGAGLPATD